MGHFKFLNTATPCFFTPPRYTVGAANNTPACHQEALPASTGAPRQYPHTLIWRMVRCMTMSVC